MKYIFIHSIATIFLVSACAAPKGSKLNCQEATPKFESLPEYRTMVHDDEELVSIEIDEECGGIQGIQKIPDGWNFSAIAKGEDYKILIVPPENQNSVKGFRGAPELSTVFRGEWSDCYNLSITVNIVKDKKPASRKFRQKNGFTGAWVEL
jgi:hypothetical protein